MTTAAPDFANSAGAFGSSSSQPTTAPIQPDKARNEQYFERMGAENASRPDHLPPSQGGKYAGFGNSECWSACICKFIFIHI